MGESNDMIRVTCAVVSSATPADDDPSKISVPALIVSSSSWQDKKATFEEWMSPLRLGGMPVTVITDKKAVPHQIPPLRKGSLFTCSVGHDVVEYLLNCALVGEIDETPVVTSGIQPVHEPCVRVPLSVLRELRGQEGTTEAARSAIVSVWVKKFAGEEDEE